jgi:hypothetical protein
MMGVLRLELRWPVVAPGTDSGTFRMVSEPLKGPRL